MDYAVALIIIFLFLNLRYSCNPRLLTFALAAARFDSSRAWLRCPRLQLDSDTFAD
jgi:hypothetical protein